MVRLSVTRQLMEMIVQMQRDQRSWLEGQQKKQELMPQNQQVQREMMEHPLVEPHWSMRE